MEVWLAIVGVLVLALVGMVALGDAGEVTVARRGSVRRALERRPAGDPDGGAR